MKFSGMSQWTGRVAVLSAVAVMFIGASKVRAEGSDKVSFSGSVDVVTQYFFRGILQEDSGFIVQPGAEVGFVLTDSVDLTVGIWNSLHSKQTGSTGVNDIWYEADFYAGLAIAATDKIGVGIDYISYSYPNGSAGDVGEVDLSLSYDDSDMLGLSPYVLWGFEIKDSNVAASEKQYAEVGIGKDFTVVASETMPVTLSVPLTVGMSFDGYYTKTNGSVDQLGFVSLGAQLSTPLAMPDGYGDWEVYGGVDVLYLAADSVKLGSDDFAFVGKVGVSMSF